RDDILSVAGPEYAIRCDLFDFVVAELRARESACPHRIRPVRTLLENQRDNLLAFAVDLDRDLTTLAQEWQISVTTAREVLQVQFLPTWDPKRWRREAALRETLRGRYHGVCADVQELSDRVVRASSLVENLNSRLRNYFFLRRHLGKDYLTLLQFFLNHRQYLRSEDPGRVGKRSDPKMRSCCIGRSGFAAGWGERAGWLRRMEGIWPSNESGVIPWDFRPLWLEIFGPHARKGITMSELKNRLIQDMQLAGLVEGTRREYLRAVRQLAACYLVAPDQPSERKVEDYLLYVRDELGVAKGTFAPIFAGLKFFYLNTLGYDWPLFTKKKSAGHAGSGCPTSAVT